MKEISKIFIILCCVACQFFHTVYAADNVVSILNLNNQTFFDIEILQEKSGRILLPAKQIADILEIPLKINHSTKDLTFSNIKITKTFVFRNGTKISKIGNKYLQKGIMDDVKDEIFCDEKVLSEIFNSEIRTNKNDLSVYVVSEKLIKKEYQEIISYKKAEEKPFKAYIDVKKPNQRNNFTLDTISVDNNTNSDTITQIYQERQDKTKMFNNTNSLNLKGTAYGGKWNMNLSSNSYKGKLLSFAGLNFKYQNKYKDTHYEIGKISGFRNDDYQIGTGVLGTQFYNYNPEKKDYREIEGSVDVKSLVNVYINDKFQTTLNTYDGHYSLADFHCQTGTIEKLELKELNKDGSEKSILIKHYPKYVDKGFELAQKEKRHSAFLDLSGFNDRLFAQDGYVYQMTAKKLTLGFQEQYGIREDFESDTRFLYDKIISNNNNSIWAQNFYNTNSILSMGTYKNANLIDGFTAMNILTYRVNDNWKIKSILAESYSKDISEDEEKSFGYSIALNSIYEKNNLKLNFGVYNQSPNFYLSGSQYGYITDRLGEKIGLNYSYKDLNISANYNKYLCNLEQKYDTSTTDFNEVNFSLNGKIKEFAQLRYSLNGKSGSNNLGENLNYNQDLNLSKRLRNGVFFESGFQENFYSNKFNDASTFGNDFQTKYSTLYLKTEKDLTKNRGRIGFGHEIIKTASNNYENNFNRFNVSYTSPEMKRMLVSIGMGYKYQGTDKGFNYNATIGYHTKSDMIVSLGYRCDTNSGYLIDNMFIPSSTRHSVNLTVNDTFAVVPTGIKSIGQANDTKGFVEVIAYLDKNKNNIFDKDDVRIENVPIKLSWTNDVVYTDKNGKIPLATVDKGIYNVSINDETLQGNLSVAKNSKEEQLILISPNRLTSVEFKLSSAVGNIKGNLKVVDDFGRNKDTKNFIVVLHDEKDVEVAYSTVDVQGSYYFSGIEPGKYKIMLDESFIKERDLTPQEGNDKLEIDIPFVYKNFVDITPKDLIYKML